ncbi:MAG: tetratricopeptide repeat protein [Anaerolineales bacterium]|nr:tetratricopeptide repeat protein [Anaerolineales bacterium]
MGDSENGQSSFGKWLREKRRALDLTQEAFAGQVGCARITLRRIENDALKPSKELALLLLEKVGIPQHEREAWLPFARGLADLPFKQTISFPAPIRNNLPASLTTFIGREKEQADVLQLINKHRLVTLTGSGGVGKTRLSIQAAADLLTEYPIGIWLVELAPLTDPALVPQSVCAVMGVKPDGDTSAFEALTNYLRNKKLLLLLDNCEHLIEACAQLCNSLLRSCPELRILASSREALGVDGERAYRVPSLSLPNSKSILNIIQESEAVTLFVERAKTVQPEFALTETNAPFIAQICQRLDGIALAIELAASRVKMFKVEQIAARLDDAFGLLTSGNRTALPRQQTLRALIDWSYNLLSEEEKIFLRKLSVFMGGWSLEAAEAVCENQDALELLTRLVDKSLVSVDLEHGNQVRYYLLETIRQYANEKLTGSEQLSHLLDIHLDYFLKTAERIAPELYTRKMPYWLDYLETEYANLQAALEWAQENNIEAGLHLCNALFRLWENRGENRKEGLDWFKNFLGTKNAERTTNYAWALYHVALLSSIPTYQDSPENKKWRDECLVLARELGERVCVARMLEHNGFHEHMIENYDTAREILEQSLVEARAADDELAIGYVFDTLGRVARNLSDYPQARLFAEKSVAILSRMGELRRWGVALSMLGTICHDQGDWNAARKYYEQALSVAQEARERFYISLNLQYLGELVLGIGDFEQALSFLSQAYEMVQSTPDDQELPLILINLGEIARFQGNFNQAAFYYGKS